MISHTARSSTLLTLALIGAAMLPLPTHAQQTAGDGAIVVPVAPAPTPAPLVPRITPDLFVNRATAGPPIAPDLFVDRATAGPPELILPQDRVHAGTNIAMMVVGGAALVAGLVIGDDTGMIIATTGAVVGLVGLYRYLR